MQLCGQAFDFVSTTSGDPSVTSFGEGWNFITFFAYRYPRLSNVNPAKILYECNIKKCAHAAEYKAVGAQTPYPTRRKSHTKFPL